VGQRVLNHRQVDRVQHDDGIVVHAQGRRGIDPVAIPAGRAQLGKNFAGVVPALRGDDDVALLECGDVVRVFQRAFVLCDRRRLAASVRGREEHRLDQAEIAFGLHPVHQDRADHAAPADQADQRLPACSRGEECVCHVCMPLKEFKSLRDRPGLRSQSALSPTDQMN